MFILAISPGEGFDPARWGRVIHSGLDALMIREKGMPSRRLLELARWVRSERPGLELWVNGRLDVALAAKCGLHAPDRHPAVPASLLPLSRPLHGLGQIQGHLEARQLLVSPVFPVPGKGPALGVQGLHEMLEGLRAYRGRILALGGIQASRLPSLPHPRLAGVAVIRALWGSADPSGEVNRMRDSWKA